MELGLVAIIWLVYAFLIWRKFRLDSGEREILKFCIWSGMGLFGLGLWLGIWVGIITFLAILWYFNKRYRWDGFEMLDFILPFAVFSFLFFMGGWNLGWGKWGWMVVIPALTGIMVNWRYRKFRWYKSGKPGLGGLSTLAAVGLLLVIKGFLVEGKQYFGIQIDQIAGVWLLTGSLVSVYLRSRLKLVK